MFCVPVETTSRNVFMETWILCARSYLCVCVVASENFGCVSVHSKIGNHKRVAFDITHTHTSL